MPVPPELELRSPPDEGFALTVDPEGDNCVVHVTGELDLATRNRLLLACTAGNHPSMVVDISALTFMDCCGYGSIVASRNAVEAGGGTFTMRGHVGQPAHLLHLIGNLERQPAAS